jgi:NNP family nitrate/nitrite transporter-like MFS transporter
MGNVGITIGMVTVTFLITRVLSGPDGWRLIFPIFAIATLLMALVYWFFTSDPPNRKLKNTSLREIFAVYRSGVVVWLVSYLYWVSFGTLTFFASAMSIYLLDSGMWMLSGRPWYIPRHWWSVSQSPGRWAAGWPTGRMHLES